MTLLSLWSLSLQRSQLTDAPSDDHLSSIIPPNPSIHPSISVLLTERGGEEEGWRAEKVRAWQKRSRGWGGVLSEFCTNYFSLYSVVRISKSGQRWRRVSTGTLREERGWRLSVCVGGGGRQLMFKWGVGRILMWQTQRRAGMCWDTKSLSPTHHLQLERFRSLSTNHPLPPRPRSYTVKSYNQFNYINSSFISNSW